jgi:hypothetical protein
MASHNNKCPSWDGSTEVRSIIWNSRQTRTEIFDWTFLGEHLTMIVLKLVYSRVVRSQVTVDQPPPNSQSADLHGIDNWSRQTQGSNESTTSAKAA